MSGLQPLSAVLGQIEAIGDRRIEINRLNLGNFDPVLAQNTVTIEKTFTLLVGPAFGRQNVDTILGGEQGDILILFGNNVRLRGNGNLIIPNNFALDLFDSIIFISSGSQWIEINRRKN